MRNNKLVSNTAINKWHIFTCATFIITLNLYDGHHWQLPYEVAKWHAVEWSVSLQMLSMCMEMLYLRSGKFLVLPRLMYHPPPPISQKKRSQKLHRLISENQGGLHMMKVTASGTFFSKIMWKQLLHKWKFVRITSEDISQDPMDGRTWPIQHFCCTSDIVVGLSVRNSVLLYETFYIVSVKIDFLSHDVSRRTDSNAVF